MRTIQTFEAEGNLSLVQGILYRFLRLRGDTTVLVKSVVTSISLGIGQQLKMEVQTFSADSALEKGQRCNEEISIEQTLKVPENNIEANKKEQTVINVCKKSNYEAENPVELKLIELVYKFTHFLLRKALVQSHIEGSTRTMTHSVSPN